MLGVNGGWRRLDAERVLCTRVINMGHGQVGQRVLRRNEPRAGTSELSHRMLASESGLSLVPQLGINAINGSQRSG